MTSSGTSEAGYIALSEAVKEIIFWRQMQDFMEPSVRIGVINVFEDNGGAIKLAVNKSCSSRSTKHIDAKHHLVRDACDAEKVIVVYARTEDQHAHLFTKPVSTKVP